MYIQAICSRTQSFSCSLYRRSINLPFNEVMETSPSGVTHLKSRAELMDLFDGREIPLDREIVTTCGSGMTACVIALALSEVGHPPMAIYDGSFAEWGADPNTSILRRADDGVNIEPVP
jgi:thiosulfate/3-mercaptopyruvate sulfurtransferase